MCEDTCEDSESHHRECRVLKNIPLKEKNYAVVSVVRLLLLKYYDEGNWKVVGKQPISLIKSISLDANFCRTIDGSWSRAQEICAGVGNIPEERRGSHPSSRRQKIYRGGDRESHWNPERELCQF